VRSIRAVGLVPLALVAGAAAVAAVDPGYSPRPLPGLFALAFAAACVGVARSRRLLALAAAVAVAGGLLVYARAPDGLDRAAYARSEAAWLAAVRPYPGATAGRTQIEAQSSSDWGITFLDPPETYVASRTDTAPAGVAGKRVADFYVRQFRAEGLRTSRWTLHVPGRPIDVNGWRGAGGVSVEIRGSAVTVTAHCARSGPFDPTVREPPPCPAPSTRT
jgi:hypothetical protein